MSDTSSFATLDSWMREKLVDLYNDYFYHRQEEFWREQAMGKLPVLKTATNMLICGEDLGMIPECVSSVMQELCLLGVRIQRMPREFGKEFGRPKDYPYLAVATTSSHDMSTLRGWWEEDRTRTERYYRDILNGEGKAQSKLDPDLCEAIIRHHLDSPSMWAVFPIQDLLALSTRLRRPGNPNAERINDPANSNNCWSYRLHLKIEDLLGEEEFNARLRKMVADAKRLTAW